MNMLWLLRHGSSVSNEGGATSDSWQIPLTLQGHGEAAEASRQWALLAGAEPFKLISSPMLRARQTAEHILARYPHVSLHVVPDLREFEPFDFSQLPPMSPEQRRPLMERYWSACNPEQVGSGVRAESFAGFRKRVQAVLDDIRSSPVRTLAVCHGGVIKLATLLTCVEGPSLDPQALMRAWLVAPTIKNCGCMQVQCRQSCAPDAKPPQ